MLRVLDEVGAKARINIFNETSVVIEIARELKPQLRKIGIKVLVNGVNIAKPHARGRYIFELADVEESAEIVFYSATGEPFDYTIRGGLNIECSRKADTVILQNLSIIGKVQIQIATLKIENGYAIFERKVEMDSYVEQEYDVADDSTPYTAKEGVAQINEVLTSRNLLRNLSIYQVNIMLENQQINKFDHLLVCVDNSASCKKLQEDFNCLVDMIHPVTESLYMKKLAEVEENEFWISNGIPECDEGLMVFISDLPYNGDSSKVFSLVVCEQPFKSEWARDPQTFCVDRQDIRFLNTGEKNDQTLSIIREFYKKLSDNLGEK